MKVLLTPTPLIAYEIEVCDYEPKINDKNELTIMCEIALLCHLDDLEGEHDILGFCYKGVIDFDCEPYLKCFETYGKDREYTYQYIKEGFIHHTCSKNKAFIDLLESHSLSLDKKYLIIKPKN